MKTESTRRRARFWPKLLVALAATALVLVVAEVGLRVLGVAPRSLYVHVAGIAGTVQDDELFWRFTPRGGHDPVHEIGIRGGVFSVPRMERDLRILCVGDSCTWGFPILVSEGYGMVLDRRMQARLPDACVETVLAAAPGYSTYQDLVLLRRHASQFAADATILYVGSWNDLFPASGYRDAGYGAEIARLEHHPVWSLRLGRILWRALHPIPSVDEKKKELEFATPAAQSATARVSLDEFQSNLRDLVAFGRASGVVLGVVPPSETLEHGMPWAPDYRRAMLEVYRELGVPCADADEAFRAYAARHPAAAIGARDYMGADDHVHPSAIGHAALAEALEPLLVEAAGAKIRSLETPPPWKRATISSIEPATLAPGRPARVRIHGAGFAGTAAPRRILLDDRAVQEFRIADQSTIELDVVPELLCRPGPLAIELRSAAGVVRASPAPEVLAWTPQVTIAARDGRRVLRLSVETESALFVVAWISTQLLEVPRATKWGSFALDDPKQREADPGETQGSPLAPGLPRIECGRFESGPAPLSGEIEIPADFAPTPSAPLYAQVFIRYGYAPESAWLSGIMNLPPK